MELAGDRKWSCEYCTYENWPASKKCVLCRAPKLPQYIDEDVPTTEQDIYKMAPPTYPDSLGPCSSHSAGNGGGVQTMSTDAGDKWSCEMCTYLNWPKATKCAQCLTARPQKARLSATRPLSVDVNIAEPVTSGPAPSKKNSPSSPEAAKAMNNDRNRAMVAGTRLMATPAAVAQTKWPCKSCTYENWMRSIKCVLCGMPRSRMPSSMTMDIIATSPEKELSLNLENRPGATKRRSQFTSAINCSEGIEQLHLGGGASASPSIYHQQADGRHAAQEPFSRAIGVGAIVSKNDDKFHQFRNRFRDMNWQWLNACQGVVDGDLHAVEAYLAAGGDPGRQLTADESDLLCRPSAFTAGHTLIHLALRFKHEDILAALLAAPEAVSKAQKRVPSYVAPDIASEIMRDISRGLRQRKGDFPCYFLMDYSTFALPGDIEDLPNEVRKQLFEELLDSNVQKELEDDEPVINWSSEITERLGSRLYPLWNRTAGDCLLDSVLQACWGVMDRDNTLRRALADSLGEGAMLFYRRWKETESIEAELLNFSLEESQWEQDWAILLSLASQPGASLEQIHIFALAHILRRPIIVYGIKFVKSYHGDNIGLARFQGVYLPLFWEQSFCWRTPIALGYTRGHFSALVPMEVDVYANVGAQANISNNEDEDDVPVTYLPLMDYEGKVLPIHFLQRSEIGHEQLLLRDWLDCCVTEGGLLVAKQRLTKPHILVRQMVDEWLQRYRRLTQLVQSSAVAIGTGLVAQTSSPTCALSSDEDTDDE